MMAPTISSKADAPFPQPVTALSDNHFDEHLANIESAQRAFGPGTTIIVYDLGLTVKQVEYLDDHDGIELRELEWEPLNPHVDNLHTDEFRMCG